jgi:hypothetical protein
MTKFAKNGEKTNNVVKLPQLMSPLEKNSIAVAISDIISADTSTTLKTKKFSNNP